MDWSIYLLKISNEYWDFFLNTSLDCLFCDIFSENHMLGNSLYMGGYRKVEQMTWVITKCYNHSYSPLCCI